MNTVTEMLVRGKVVLAALSLMGGVFSAPVFAEQVVFDTNGILVLEKANSSKYEKLGFKPVVSKSIKRGEGRSLILEPAPGSIDPDAPDMKSFSVTWKCRSTQSDDLHSASNFGVNLGSSIGCFGHSSGDHDMSAFSLEFYGSDFVGQGTFELVAEISGDEFRAEVSFSIEVYFEQHLDLDVLNIEWRFFDNENATFTVFEHHDAVSVVLLDNGFSPSVDVGFALGRDFLVSLQDPESKHLPKKTIASLPEAIEGIKPVLVDDYTMQLHIPKEFTGKIELPFVVVGDFGNTETRSFSISSMKLDQ